MSAIGQKRTSHSYLLNLKYFLDPGGFWTPWTGALDLCFLRHLKGIVDLNAQVANRALELGVAKE